MSAVLAEHDTPRDLDPADKALYAALRAAGHAYSADQAREMRLVEGGRDAIRDSMRRLKHAGLIVVQKRMYSPGHWRNRQVFADQVEVPTWGLRLVPDLPEDSHCDQSGVQVLGGLGVQSQSQDQEIKMEEEKSTLLPSPRGASRVLEIVPVSLNTPTGPRCWPPATGAVRSHRTPRKTPCDPDLKETTVLRGSDPDDLDFVNPLAASPSSPTRPAPRGSLARFDKPPERWTSFDLVTEFNSRAHRAGAGEIPHQINTRNLGGALGRLIHSGSRPEVLAQCIELFFAAPRNMHDMGEGYPLWRRFLAQITSTYVRATKIVDQDTILDADHYAEDVALSDAQFADLADAWLESARKTVTEDVKPLQEAVAARTASLTPVVSNVLHLAAREAQRAAEAAAAHARMKAVSEAHQAEHPDEEWVVEDEEEWTPENDDVVSA